MSRALHHRLAAALAAAGVSTMFGLPGGGPNLDVIGAAAEHGIRFVLAHGETNAAIMASTHGLLTATATPVVVTRGPGAASVVNGVAQATLDRYPLLVVTDTVPARMADRVAHQRIDQRAMLAPVSKATATLGDDIADGELAQWIDIATTWPCGAVHLDYDPSGSSSFAPSAVGAGQTGDLDASAALADGRRLLAHARRPVLIVGMEAAVAAHQDPRLSELLMSLGCPVLTTYQAAGVVPTESDVAAGLFTNGALERPVLDAADLFVTIGLDPVEPIPAPWTHDQPVIRVSSQTWVDPYLPATVHIIGDLAEALTQLVQTGDAEAADDSGWEWAPDAGSRFRTEARDRLHGSAGSDRTPPPAAPQTLSPLELVTVAIDRAAPNVATVTVDAGAHFLSIMPLWPVQRPFELLISNGSATMGFAVPAAIGAAVATGEPILALVGDGGLAMTLSELETIGRYHLPVTVVVFNDAALSLIEIKQQADHGGPGAVRYVPTDLAAVAEGLGIAGRVVMSVDELTAALDGGWTTPRLIEVRVDPADYGRLIAVTRG